MARVLEEIPQEIELEASETEAMLRGPSASPRSCSRSSVGFALLGVAVVAMVLALALPQEHRLRKSHESVIGLDDDSIWASVLSPDAMKQYQHQKEKSEAKASETVSKVQKSASDVASSLNSMLTKPAPAAAPAAPAPAAPAPAAPAPAPVKTAEPVSKLQEKAQDTVNQLEANMEDPMKAVQNAADQVKSVLNIGLPPAAAPKVPAPAPAVPVTPIALPPAPKIKPLPMPVVAPPAATGESKADKIKKMAEEYMQEAAKTGNAKQKAQLESLAKMLKKDAAKVAGTAKATPVVPGQAPAVAAPPVAAPPVAAPPVAAPVVQTVTDNPSDSPLAPQVSDKSGDPCVDDEEDFGGLCYKKCSILSGGSHPCRSSAWSCCAVPEGPSCASKASFGNCWVHIGFCGGYSVAGDAEVAQTGNSCPTGEGGCLTNEEMFGNECFKKCSLLDPQHPHRVGPDSCCSKPGGFDCFWPSNLKSSPNFNVGGGEGDKNSGTPASAHAPMLQLSQ